MNKAIIDSYLRNLLGVVLALVMSTMTTAGVASPFEFTVAEWLAVANGFWAAAVPTLIRYFNKQDPAFGRVAEVVVKEVAKKLDDAVKAEEAKKPATKKKTSSTTKKPTSK